MEEFRVMEIRKNVFDSNDREAERLRGELREQGLFLMNLMSSPGSGKTTTVLGTLESMKRQYACAVIEADLDSDVDARRVHESGAKVVQLHSGGMCHLTADMTRQGLDALGREKLDFVILENIGNLICTAEFDTGAALNVMILSVPEGDDKPLKYPVMFSMAHVLLVNKIDTMDYFDFSLERLEGHVRKINRDIKIFPLSAKTGQGMGEWIDWLEGTVAAWRDRA